MEDAARIVDNATPKLAKIISHKHTKLNTNEVKEDLLENSNLGLTNDFIKRISESVANISHAREDRWEYLELPVADTVHTISLGLDGTCMYLIEKDKHGWREAVVGTIALYNNDGDRIHTIYTGATPEYGKLEFYRKMSREIEKIKNFYPDAKYIGLADGARDIWKYLEKHTDVQITDFWHATEYIKGAATAIFKEEAVSKKWLEDKCHDLKHKKFAVTKIIKELEKTLNDYKFSKDKTEQIQKAITYFTNQKKRMHYYDYVKSGYPIGSGVTEAGCKIVIKARFCQSGMRWKKKGASAILTLRCLNLSKRWSQFWQKINQYGVVA